MTKRELPSLNNVMALSLVQKDNWTNPTAASTPESADEDGKSKTNNDLVCKRHRGTKLSLLVHIIEGFVIEESNVPFKGSEEEVETGETTKPVVDTQDETQAQTVEADEENEIANASMNSYPQDKDELMSLLPTTCKYCGGELPEDRAMWGKRFCSVSCGKKYSVQCSQRVRRALQRRNSQSSASANAEVHDMEIDVDKVSPTPAKKRRVKGSLSSDAKSHTGAESTSTPKKSKLPSVNMDLHFTFPPRVPVGYGIDMFDVENDLYDGGEPLLKYSVIPMIKWTPSEVFDYINNVCGSMYAKRFNDDEIDGQALLLLKIEHMVHTMNMKLGPALKLASHLRLIKLQYGVETRTKYLSSLEY